MTSRFNTLLLREWMQHKRGWLVTLLVPPLLFLLMLPFGEVSGAPKDQPLGLAVAAIVTTTGLVCLLAAMSATFQLPGLARRDVQDRSIEFWLSLPASHSESIGATLAAHLLLVPLCIALAAYGIGYVVAAALALKAGGVAVLASIPWASVVSFTLPLLLRLLLGVVLGLLWMAPLVMIFMNAAVWLKRWGVPAVAASAVILLAIVPKLYGITLFKELLHAQWMGFLQSFVHSVHTMDGQAKALLQGNDVAQVAAWAWQDGLSAVQALASPHLIGGLVFAAFGFWLLIQRRRRGA